MFKSTDPFTAESKPKRKPGRPRKDPGPVEQTLREKYGDEPCDVFEREFQNTKTVESVTEEEFIRVLRRIGREKGRAII